MLVLSAFMAMLAALAALWRYAATGAGLGELASAAASHSTGQGVVAFLKDVLVY